MVVDPKRPRVEMATVGLGSLAWPSGHYAHRLVAKTWLYMFTFQYSDPYQTNHKPCVWYTIFPLQNMPAETSHKHVPPCVSHAKRGQHICRYFSVSKQVFLACFQSIRSCEEKRAQWFCDTCLVLMCYRFFKFLTFVMREAFHGVVELARILEHVSKNIKLMST